MTTKDIFILGLVITNLIVIYKLNSISNKADELQAQIQPTVDAAKNIIDKINQIVP